MARPRLRKIMAYIGIERVKAMFMNLTINLVGRIISVNRPIALTMPTIQ